MAFHNDRQDIWLSYVPLPSMGAAARLLHRSSMAEGPPGPEHLDLLCRLFARFPYENVTKIIRRGEGEMDTPPFRDPGAVVEGFLQSGAGGTCFSLTNLFLQVLFDLGYNATPFLARMGGRQNVHCGVLVQTEGAGRALIDPGYLVDRPLPVVPGRHEHRTRHARILLDSADGFCRLSTLTGGEWKERYVFEERPPDRETFIKAWAASFEGPGMNQICLTRGVDGGYLYLHGRHLRRVSGAEKQVHKLAIGDSDGTAQPFGIDPQLVSRAMEILDSRRKD